MSKFFKGMAKVAKNIGHGIQKVFKKVMKSKVFKIVLIAVAIYFGGAMLGLWGGTGAAGAGGVAAATGGGTTAAGTTAAGTTAAGTTAAGTTAAGTGATLATGTEVSAALTAAPTAGAGAGLATGADVATALTAAAPEVAAAPSFLSTLGSGASSVGSFVQANPLATAMGFNALSSALSPDELDLLKEQENIRKREFEATLESRRQNLTGFNTLPLLHQAQGNVSTLRNRRLGG